MISRKESLLIKPWQQKTFDHHRQKVQSALPAIDTGPPPYRDHVNVKLKKQQKEKERCKKIEKDNYLLLQKLNYITRTSRVDNRWKTPQPNFLNKVPIYHTIIPKLEDLIELDFEQVDDHTPKKRKSRCVACTPQKIEKVKIPEERIPWEPERITVKKGRSKSVPVRKPQPLLSTLPSNRKPSSCKVSDKEERRTTQEVKLKAIGKQFSVKEPQSIVLSRGCLKLSVNFPSDTVVKFQEGNVEKFLMKGICNCKFSPTEVF
ncbi:hypothetical protein JTB14_031354 [Gonioctena quinquepunctata]|nr:hypothetical protein JTB14_031354 [Gonioctena quinquepunctata]